MQNLGPAQDLLNRSTLYQGLPVLLCSSYLRSLELTPGSQCGCAEGLLVQWVPGLMLTESEGV